MIITLFLFVFIVLSCGENPGDRPENELATFIIANQWFDPVLYEAVLRGSEEIRFKYSCNTPSEFTCKNVSGNDFFYSDPEDNCTSIGGRVAKTRCASENAIGVCNHSDEDSILEFVYYEGYSDASIMQEECEKYNGVFSTSYTGEN